MAPTTDPKNALTDRERELMALAWLCFSEKPKPDYKKLAALAGMSNPVSASNAWSKIQKKITAQAEDVSTGSGHATPEVQTPKATPGKKRAAAAGGKAADGESPTKKRTKTPSKKTKVKEEVVEDDGLDGNEDAEGDSEPAFF